MPNKVYINTETSRAWSDATTALDELIDCGGLATGAVRCGSFHDLGAAPRSEWYEVEFLISGFDAAPVVGEGVDLYFTQSNATTGFSGAPTTDPTTTVEGTITANQLKNLLGPIVSAIVVSTIAADELRVFAVVRLTSRYVAPVVHNNTADALLSTSDAHTVTLTPIPQEIQ